MPTNPSRIYPVLSANRRVLAYALYAAMAALAYGLAYLVRFELVWPTRYTRPFLLSLPVLLAVRLGVNWWFKLSTGRWRYVGLPDVFRLVAATTVGSLIFVLAIFALPLAPRPPHSVVVLEWLLTTSLTAGLWMTYRSVFQSIRRRSVVNGDSVRVLVLGAGEAGSRLVHEMTTFPTRYLPVGFVDDDPLKWGTRVHGVEIVGALSDLKPIAQAVAAEAIVIAVPSAGPEALRDMVERCSETGLPYEVLPRTPEVLEGQVRLNQLRKIQIEDLLGREPIRLSLPELAEDFAERAILITGAAGSIGSELARQVARHHPASLVLLDRAESDLYFLERDLRAEHPELDVHPVMGDVVDPLLVDSVFARFEPDRVFHAAAYKHVPMMEINVREAVRNNVAGTRMVAEAAGRHGCGRFVLISTDKAVRPTSVMGATKALAERVVQAAQHEYPGTSFMAVRFGNVLGSQGSVIPIFRQQLERDRPLTVTHPEATRFFMTIPEATQLVLQASLLENARGRIAMLDMGSPIRILDLARNLIRLSGHSGDPDNRITYVGLRPGEKLHEELSSADEDLVPTHIPKVRLIIRRHGVPDAELRDWIERWRVEVQDPELVRSLVKTWAWCCGAMGTAVGSRVDGRQLA